MLLFNTTQMDTPPDGHHPQMDTTPKWTHTQMATPQMDGWGSNEQGRCFCVRSVRSFVILHTIIHKMLVSKPFGHLGNMNGNRKPAPPSHQPKFQLWLGIAGPLMSKSCSGHCNNICKHRASHQATSPISNCGLGLGAL